MRWPLPVLRVLGGGLVVLVLAEQGAAAPARKKKKPTPTPTALPMPTPPALMKAAGSVVHYVPGKHIIVAEVGSTGRVFHVDAETQIETMVRTGARVRILWFEGRAGPVARQILPGPTLATPTPLPKKN